MERRKDIMNLKNLRKLREKAGLSQTELAAKLGVDARTINRWEDGKHRPHRVYLKMLNRILGQLTNKKIKKGEKIVID